jgi:hypothetical protein
MIIGDRAIDAGTDQLLVEITKRFEESLHRCPPQAAGR